jgi:hypothetical protein
MLSGIPFEISSFRNRPSLNKLQTYIVHQVFNGAFSTSGRSFGLPGKLDRCAPLTYHGVRKDRDEKYFIGNQMENSVI